MEHVVKLPIGFSKFRPLISQGFRVLHFSDAWPVLDDLKKTPSRSCRIKFSNEDLEVLDHVYIRFEFENLRDLVLSAILCSDKSPANYHTDLTKHLPKYDLYYPLIPRYYELCVLRKERLEKEAAGIAID